MSSIKTYRIFYERKRYIGPTDRQFGLECGAVYQVKIGNTEGWTAQGLPCVKVRELEDSEFVYSDISSFLDCWEEV